MRVVKENYTGPDRDFQTLMDVMKTILLKMIFYILDNSLFDRKVTKIMNVLIFFFHIWINELNDMTGCKRSELMTTLYHLESDVQTAKDLRAQLENERILLVEHMTECKMFLSFFSVSNI